MASKTQRAKRNDRRRAHARGKTYAPITQALTQLGAEAQHIVHDETRLLRAEAVASYVAHRAAELDAPGPGTPEYEAIREKSTVNWAPPVVITPSLEETLATFAALGEAEVTAERAPAPTAAAAPTPVPAWEPMPEAEPDYVPTPSALDIPSAAAAVQGTPVPDPGVPLFDAVVASRRDNPLARALLRPTQLMALAQPQPAGFIQAPRQMTVEESWC